MVTPLVILVHGSAMRRCSTRARRRARFTLGLVGFEVTGSRSQDGPRSGEHQMAEVWFWLFVGVCACVSTPVPKERTPSHAS